MSDGLTALQHRGMSFRLWAVERGKSEWKLDDESFDAGYEFGRQFESARAEAAEARAAELEAENARLLSQYSIAKERRVQIELTLRGVRDVAMRNGGGSPLTVMSGYSSIVERVDAAIAAPTTEAVTE